MLYYRRKRVLESRSSTKQDALSEEQIATLEIGMITLDYIDSVHGNEFD